MADGSKIEWTEASWNPVTGCTEVSPGCDHCYAKTFAERWRGTPGHPYERGFDLTLRPERLDQPIRWKRGRRIFVNSMSDLFHEDVSLDYLARVFAVMALTPQHTYQILTKRHGRMRSVMRRSDFRTAVDLVLAGWAVGPLSPFKRAALAATEPAGSMGWVTWPLPNVWLGVSVEDQHWADVRVPALLDTPAAVRFLSCEPLLGPVHLGKWLVPTALNPPRLHWVIVGGESGHGYRTVDAEWVRDLRNECVSAGVPFLFKQWGGRTSKAGGRELDGQTWDQYPKIAPQISSPTPTLL